MRHCAICGDPIEAGQNQVYSVSGWEEKRAGGGANKIIGRVETGAVAHKSCALAPGQQTLGDLGEEM